MATDLTGDYSLGVVAPFRRDQPMRRKRKRSTLWPPPPLTEGQILAWADAFHDRTGRWSCKDSYHLAVICFH
jgi:hypothetical protein